MYNVCILYSTLNRMCTLYYVKMTNNVSGVVKKTVSSIKLKSRWTRNGRMEEWAHDLCPRTIGIYINLHVCNTNKMSDLKVIVEMFKKK